MVIFAFQAVFWTLFGSYMEIQRERIQREMEDWQGEADADQHAPWEEVPGEEDDQWDDLPTGGQQESDRPVTPDHPSQQEEEHYVGGIPPNDAAQPSTAEAAGTSTAAAPEEARAERVMRGETEPFEVFTGKFHRPLVSSSHAMPRFSPSILSPSRVDHDDPDLSS